MNTMMFLSMSWRNLWRNRRRTLVTLSGIVFGVLLAVLFTGLGDSNWTKMINLAARMGGGHVTLQHPDYLQTPSLKRTVTGVGQKRVLALEDPNVLRVVPRITGNTMLGAGGNTSGAGFLAVDPAQESVETLSLLEALAEGKMFSTADDKGIILGQKLADNLGVKMGRKVVYTLSDKKNEIVSGLARVTGIVRTGSSVVDAGLCLLPLGTVRKTLGYADDEVTQVAVFIDDQRRSKQVAARLIPLLDQQTTALTWDEIKPDLAGFIAMKTVSTLIMEIIIGILVAAGIFNTLFVSVMERRREFGIMIALGYSPGQLFRLILLESAWIGLCGLVLALVVTAYPYYYFSTTGLNLSTMIGEGGSEIAGLAMDPIMRIAIFPENAAYIAVAAFCATLVSGIYPAWRAGRVAPVESIKLV